MGIFLDPVPEQTQVIALGLSMSSLFSARPTSAADPQTRAGRSRRGLDQLFASLSSI